MRILIDVAVKSLFVEEVFSVAIANAIAFLSRSDTRDKIKASISSLVTDFDLNGFNSSFEETYTLHVIEQKSKIHGFCCVYALDDLTGVYFNPCLLVGIMHQLARFEGHSGIAVGDASEPAAKKQEVEIPTSSAWASSTLVAPVSEAHQPTSKDAIISICILFITTKLIHEICHLVNRFSSPTMKALNLTPPKIRLDKMLDGTVVSVAYTDFGMLMERELLGGGWELSHKNKNLFMVPEFVVVYPSAQTKIGQYLDFRSSFIDGRGASIVLTGMHKSKAMPSFSASVLPDGPACLTKSASKGHSVGVGDVSEGEDEDEADGEGGGAGGMKGARF